MILFLVDQVNKLLCNENSVFPKHSTAYNRSCAATSATMDEKLELSTFDNGNGMSQMTQATTINNLGDVEDGHQNATYSAADVICAPGNFIGESSKIKFINMPCFRKKII